jgi:hypothetical protein
MPIRPMLKMPPITPVKMIHSGTPAPRPIKSGLRKLSSTPIIMPRTVVNTAQPVSDHKCPVVIVSISAPMSSIQTREADNSPKTGTSLPIR